MSDQLRSPTMGVEAAGDGLARSAMDVRLGRSELRLIVDALGEYAEACLLAAEMAVGRDEQLRLKRVEESNAAQRLREAIRQSAA